MIDPRSFARSLLSLSQLRMRQLLGDPPDPVRQERKRSNVAAWLAMQMPPGITGDTLNVDLIEGASAAAMAKVDEDYVDRLSNLCVATELLARDSQFGRLEQLAAEFLDIANLSEVERPYLTLTSRAFAHAVRHAHRDALVLLSQTFSIGGERQPVRVARSSEQIGDLVLAKAFGQWLSTRGTELLESAREHGSSSGNALLFEMSSMLLAYAEAANAASFADAVRAQSAEFSNGPLAGYLNERGIATLFPAQIRALKQGVLNEGSQLVALPTSSGKTLLAELRIAAQFARSPESRVIYVAPYRLLARQVERDLRGGLHRLQKRVADIGSDFDISLEGIGGGDGVPDVAIATPERLDALMRLADTAEPEAGAVAAFFNSVELLVFDEIHLVGRPSRGPRLELLLTRLRLRYPQVQVLGLSGVIGNTPVLASWLGPNEPIFGGRRPTGSVELRWKTDGDIEQRVAARSIKVRKLNRKTVAIADAVNIVLRLARELQPALVVENTRPNAELLARKIVAADPEAGVRWFRQLLAGDLRSVNETAEEVRETLGQEHELAKLVQAGVAYHHAGLPANLLRTIEGLVQRKLLRALCSTTTVAEGAHLPFRLVIIPHLNFEGATRRLEKDIYLNILGRAGRANIAMEGIVLVLESDADTLKGLVKNELWNDSRPVRVVGRLRDAAGTARRPSDIESRWDLDGQVLAWVGDSGSYRDNQAEFLASRTFSALTEPQALQVALTRVITASLERLAASGFVHAGSPYEVTPIGSRARLSGMAPESCRRLMAAVSSPALMEMLLSLPGSHSLDLTIARGVARGVYETLEVLQHGLWFRRSTGTDERKVQVLKSLQSGEHPWPYDDELYWTDVEMLARWINGESYEKLGEIPPVFGGSGLFGKDDVGARAADAADQMGRVAYPAGWAWSSILAMAGLRTTVPGWVRRAVQLGVPTETAVRLIDAVPLSRQGAIRMAVATEANWENARDLIQVMAMTGDVQLSASDRTALQQWEGE